MGGHQYSWDRVQQVPKNSASTYFGQCSLALPAQLEGSKGFEKIKADQDVVELACLIMSICCKYDQNTDETYAVVTSLKNLLYFYQNPNVTNNNYLKEFKEWVESIDDFNEWTLGNFPSLVKKKLVKLHGNWEVWGED